MHQMGLDALAIGDHLVVPAYDRVCVD
jgi:hypothetical protein